MIQMVNFPKIASYTFSFLKANIAIPSCNEPHGTTVLLHQALENTNPALANCSAAHIYNLLKGKINQHSAGLCDVERLEFVEEKKADERCSGSVEEV